MGYNRTPWIMSSTKIFSHALTWYTQDLRTTIELLPKSQQERFYNQAGESERDLRIWMEAFFESISDGLVEQINIDMLDAINETISQ